MGTSSSFRPPSGIGHMAYPIPPPQDLPAGAVTDVSYLPWHPTLPTVPSWTEIKRLINHSLAGGNVHREALSSLVHNLRLRSGSAATGIGVRSLIGTGAFLSAARERGIPAAAAELGIQNWDQMSRDQAIIVLSDRLAVSGSGFDSTDLREATYDALAKHIDDLGDVIDANSARAILQDIVVGTLYRQLIRYCGEKIQKVTTPEERPRLERDIRDVLTAMLEDYVHTFDIVAVAWNSREAIEIVSGWLGDTQMIFGLE